MEDYLLKEFEAHYGHELRLGQDKWNGEYYQGWLHCKDCNEYIYEWEL